MRNASYALVDALKEILVDLATFYPAGHWGDGGAEVYFSERTKSLFEWQRRHAEPYGPECYGTMVHLMVAARVQERLEQMVVEMVNSLTSLHGGINFHAWKKAWTGKDA